MVRITLLAFAALAVAFPTEKRDVEPPTRQPAGSTDRTNVGVNIPAGFDAEAQYVDVTDGGKNPFQAPGPNDIRGQCPGLNAAANHGFLPRNGIATIEDTVNGLGAAYNMAPDTAAVLAAISIALSGDPVAGTWSIGGKYPGTLPSGLVGEPGGIKSLHNKYEGDASIVRGDAYLNNGEVNNFQYRSWNHLMEIEGGYTLDKINGHNDYVQQYSIYNNPYYFTGFFAGIVTPAAHNFVINFMSNHSEEVPGGTLDQNILKQFFSVTGDSPSTYNHTYNQERIPLNWYKRPAANAYTVPDVFTDVIAGNTVYPGLIRFGGNTGQTNTFTGIDTGNLTGGVFNAETLFEGNNLACFAFQATLANEPDAAEPLLGAAGSALSWLEDQLTPTLTSLGCPQLKEFNNGLFAQFPGASYQANSPNNNKPRGKWLM